MSRRARALTRSTAFDREAYHLVLLCENETGYRNLSYMVSRGFLDGFYNRPRVDMELLREHHEGIIALSACLAGRGAAGICCTTSMRRPRRPRWRYADIFGPEHFYLELQDHGLDGAAARQPAASCASHRRPDCRSS